ncbi:uncharacterized protein LOC134254582, partial [Saccostrea cucullata]|uniref:uncharacterized protein LOC134254582 n=1 Tax=Saccostrea cuccullata TaxID=36930 RepID=UPI002ED1FEED
MMDNIGKGAGLGSHTDGAFERFLTAAIATIITILFSWRLLEEEQNQVDNGRPQQKFRSKQLTQTDIKPDKNSELDHAKETIVGNSTSQCPTAEVSNSADLVSKCATNDGSGPEDYCVSDDEDDSPTWANYSWEEDMYGAVHTRRSARDFISSAKALKDSEKSSPDEYSDFSPPMSSQMLEEMYVNSEYRSAVEDSENHMEITDSSNEEEEDESDEGEFECSSPDDNQIYCPQTLAPIIEEDSDDEFDDSDESESENLSPRNETENIPEGLNERDFLGEKEQSTHEVEAHFHSSCEQSNTEALTPPIVTNEEKQHDWNLNVNETESKECGEFDSKSDIITANNRPENLTYFDSDEAELMCNSPVRTCAIEDDENLSDESCSTCSSSASVMTVVSVNTWELNKTKEKVEIQQTSQACSILSECEKVKDPTNESLLAFIHHVESPSEDSCKSDLTKSSQSTNTIDRDLNSEVHTDLEVTIPGDLHATNKKQRAASDLDYDEFVQDISDQSEFRKDGERNRFNENGQINPSFLEEIRNSLLHDNRFDDDVEPREYNPFEDDFCDSGEETDDSDSFFMVVGNNGHLRNFETVNNLNIAGLSQPCEDLRALMRSPNQSLVYSRTEDITIEQRSRYFMRERNTDTENSAEYLNNINEIDLVIRESNERLNECPVISESAYPSEDLEKETLHKSDNCDGPYKEDVIIIDEKTRLLNEANAASTNIDFIQHHNASAVEIENIRSYTTLSLQKDNADHDENRDKNLIQRANQRDEISESKEINPPCTKNVLHILEEDLTPETQSNNQEQNLSNEQPENTEQDQNKEKLIDKTNIDKDTVDIIDNMRDPDKNVSIQTSPNETSVEEITCSSEQNVQAPSNLSENPEPIQSDLSTTDNKVLDANSNVKNLLHIEEEPLSCDIVNSKVETSPKSDKRRTETTFDTIEPDEWKSDLDIMKPSKPIDQAVYDQNLEIWNKYLDKSATSRVAHTPLQKPSSFRRDSKGVKAKLSKHLQKKRPPIVYESVLLAPVAEPEKKTFVFELPKNVPLSRQKIFAMRHKFLSQECLAPSPMHDKFASHKASLTSIPRTGRYKKRELSSSRNSLRNSSIERIDHISNMYSSRLSWDESFEKRELHSLHENCMFSPEIHEEILNTTESIDHLNSSFSVSGSDMMRYSSMASLVETDIDTGETTETLFVYPDSDVEYDFDFQSSIKRA